MSIDDMFQAIYMHSTPIYPTITSFHENNIHHDLEVILHSELSLIDMYDIKETGFT